MKSNHNQIDMLVTGMMIFRKYNEAATFFGSTSSNRIIQTQESEFIDISKEEIDVLNETGWECDENGMLWFFKG